MWEKFESPARIGSTGPMLQVPAQMGQRVTVAQDPRIFLQNTTGIGFFFMVLNPPKHWFSMVLILQNHGVPTFSHVFS